MTTDNVSLFTPDTLHRGVKMALDTGEAATVEEGYAIFAKYRMSIAVGREIEVSRAHQAALLTVINTARRSLLGGVKIIGNLDVPLLVSLPGGHRTMAKAVAGLGGIAATGYSDDEPLLLLGTVAANDRRGVTLVLGFEGWRSGVWPAGEADRLEETKDSILAAILAAALGTAEVFQHLRGNDMAGRRACGMSLWNPAHSDWRAPDGGPSEFVGPSRLWLVGLGHLGQAYLWTLGLLPYAASEEVEITVQDFDKLTLANDSTSILTDTSKLGQPKTRAMCAWLEERGFHARMVERRFAGDVVLQDDDPRILLCGVDNVEARAALEDAGFDLVVEAGLGAGPAEYLAMRVHTFPASVTSRQKWGGVDTEKELGSGKAYDDLTAQGRFDACGLVQLATRTVGAPFVGVVAATLVIAEVLRRLNGGGGCEVVDLTLRSLEMRLVVPSTLPVRGFNPGFSLLSFG